MADVCGDSTAGYPLGAPIAQAYSDGENFSCWLDASDQPERDAVRALCDGVITRNVDPAPPPGLEDQLIAAANIVDVAAAYRCIGMIDAFEAP